MYMKNNKGFTLVELLLTLALLGIISVISFVSISAIVNKNRDNQCELVVNNLEVAIRDYVSDNKYNDIDFSQKFNGSVLVGYLSGGKAGNIVDPYTKENIALSDIEFKVTLNNDKSVKSVKIYNAGDTTESELFNACVG